MKLFVGNLSWNINEDTLRNEFASYGSIEECRLITDRETGRSRGFGFVTFADQEQAQKALTEMDGRELDGRALKVNEANERPQRQQRNNRW